MTDVRQDLTQVAGALADLARQASYVAIGAGILGLQKAQVRRREMANVAGRALKGGPCGREDLRGVVRDFDTNMAQVIKQIDSAVEPIFERLPGPVQAALQQARETRDELRARLLGLNS
jgi:hypothetical protein